MVHAGADQELQAASSSPSTTERWQCFDFLLGFLEPRDLRPGILDKDAVYVFTNGHCHSFAEAMARQCRAAELVFAFDLPDGEDEGLRAAQGHVLNRISGRYLDARGWVDELIDTEDANRVFEERWDRVLAIEPEGWNAMSGGWLPLRVDAAMPFADALLQRLWLPSEDVASGGDKGR